jgi:hypothetical protein
MTFEEMQQTLEQMLAVQRELQNSQLRLLKAQENASPAGHLGPACGL